MSYVDDNLLTGERVICRADVHSMVYFWPVLLSLCIVGIPWLLVRWIQVRCVEYAVTNKRIILKTGFIKRDTLELPLAKVESVAVSQTLLGRLMGYGAIVVAGTGTTHEGFRWLANPMQFKRALQEQQQASMPAAA